MTVTGAVFVMRPGESRPHFFAGCSCGWSGREHRYPIEADPEGDEDRKRVRRDSFVLRPAGDEYSTEAALAARRAAGEDLMGHARHDHGYLDQRE